MPQDRFFEKHIFGAGNVNFYGSLPVFDVKKFDEKNAVKIYVFPVISYKNTLVDNLKILL